MCTDTESPFIDELALTEGLHIVNSYSFKVCSPTRSSVMTGRYPSTLGLSNLVFSPNYPVALSRQISTISEEFKANGYSTHFIGSTLSLSFFVFFGSCSVSKHSHVFFVNIFKFLVFPFVWLL